MDVVKSLVGFFISLIFWLIVLVVSDDIYNSLANIVRNDLATAIVVLVNLITTINAFGSLIGLFGSVTKEM